MLSEDLPDEARPFSSRMDSFPQCRRAARAFTSSFALHIVEIKDQAQFLDEGLGDAGGEAYSKFGMLCPPCWSF